MECMWRWEVEICRRSWDEGGVVLQRGEGTVGVYESK